MMNSIIFVNGRFLLHKITGVERYARELLAELDNIIMPGEIELLIPPETIDIPCYKNIRIKKVGRFHNRLWEQISLPIYVKKSKGLSLNLCNAAPILSPGIVCIHDVKIKARPKDFSKKFLIWYTALFFNACKRAKRIITVSEFSKREIINYYHVDPTRISVIPNGWQHYNRVDYDENALEKYGLGKSKFFFSMSSMEPNKNFKWIAETARMNSDEVFAVAGSVNKKIFADGLGFECPENMKLLGYISDEEAKTLMRDCKAFLFPSHYEGFGIPPLEAISAGCNNVIVSDTEVMHEIFEDSVTYLDPNKPNSIVGEKKQDGNAILSKFSWGEVSAPQLRDLIREVE